MQDSSSGAFEIHVNKRLVYFLLLLFGCILCFVVLLLVRNNVKWFINVIPQADSFGANTAENVTAGSLTMILPRFQFLLLLLFLLGCANCVYLITVNVFASKSRLHKAFTWIIDHPAFVLSLIGVLFAAYGISQRMVFFKGTPYFVLEDDAMITLRYSRNLADGLGPVFNAGEQVEGYTNFLWMLLLAPLHKLGIPDNLLPAYVMAINWLFVILLLWFIQDILARFSVKRVWIFIIGLGFLLDVNTVFWSVSGLETILLALVVTMCVWAILAEREYLSMIALALVPLVRSDAVLLGGILGLFFLWERRKSMPRTIILLICAAAPSVLHLVFAKAYYGDWLPNTYYLKTLYLDNLWISGVSYSYRILTTYLLLLVMAFGAVIYPRLRFVLFLIAAQIIYIVYIGGDDMWFLRFLTPVIPLIYVCAGIVIQRIVSSVPNVISAVLLVIVAIYVPVIGPGGTLGEIGMNSNFAQYVTVAQYLKSNLPAGSSVAVEAAGMVPYFAPELDFVDELGKTDAHIAHVKPIPNNAVIGHNKVDYDYVYDQRRPDVVLTHASCQQVADHLKLSKESWDTLFSQLPTDEVVSGFYALGHPTFANVYAQHVIQLAPPPDGSTPITMCLFARDAALSQRVWTLP